LPDPTGGRSRRALAAGNMFWDMSGLAGTQALAGLLGADAMRLAARRLAARRARPARRAA
jgi:hypothetical protein